MQITHRLGPLGSEIDERAAFQHDLVERTFCPHLRLKPQSFGLNAQRRDRATRLRGDLCTCGPTRLASAESCLHTFRQHPRERAVRTRLVE